MSGRPLLRTHVTLLDAALLQRKWNYFTGGFLSVDYVQSLSQAGAAACR
jgi:hypothetical protein